MLQFLHVHLLRIKFIDQSILLFLKFEMSMNRNRLLEQYLIWFKHADYDLFRIFSEKSLWLLIFDYEDRIWHDIWLQCCWRLLLSRWCSYRGAPSKKMDLKKKHFSDLKNISFGHLLPDCFDSVSQYVQVCQQVAEQAWEISRFPIRYFQRNVPRMYCSWNPNGPSTVGKRGKKESFCAIYQCMVSIVAIFIIKKVSPMHEGKCHEYPGHPKMFGILPGYFEYQGGLVNGQRNPFIAFVV